VLSDLVGLWSGRPWRGLTSLGPNEATMLSLSPDGFVERPSSFGGYF
jgi:hypothetical protein